MDQARFSVLESKKKGNYFKNKLKTKKIKLNLRVFLHLHYVRFVFYVNLDMEMLLD